MSVRPHLIVLAAQLLETAKGLYDTAAYLKANGGRVAYGGRIFNLVPELRKHIPAHFLGESIQEAMQLIETLLTSDIPLESVTPIQQEHVALSRAFLYHRPMIDTYALTETHKTDIPVEYSIIAIQHLGNNLASALALGHIEALATEMDWIQGLLKGHLQRSDSLDDFLEAYARSVDAVMGKEGQPISDWLMRQRSRTQ